MGALCLILQLLNNQCVDKPPRFTFQELVDMIEKGIEIPGLNHLCAKSGVNVY